MRWLKLIFVAMAFTCFSVSNVVADESNSLSSKHQTYLEHIEAMRQIMFCNVDQLGPALSVFAWSRENLGTDGSVALTGALMTSMLSTAQTLRVDTAPACESEELVEVYPWPQHDELVDAAIRIQVVPECIRMTMEFCPFSRELSDVLQAAFKDAYAPTDFPDLVPLDQLRLFDRAPIVFALAGCRLRVARTTDDRERVCRMAVDDALVSAPEVSFDWPQHPFEW
jgi:hypothetical protein